MSFAIVTDQEEVRRIIVVFSKKNILIQEICKKGGRAIISRTGHECACGKKDFFCVSVPVGQQDNLLYEYVHACMEPECTHVLSTADTEGFHDQCPLCDELDVEVLESDLVQ